jgi:hypothetical protein
LKKFEVFEGSEDRRCSLTKNNNPFQAIPSSHEKKILVTDTQGKRTKEIGRQIRHKSINVKQLIIVACNLLLGNNQIYSSRYRVTASLTNMFLRNI